MYEAENSRDDLMTKVKAAIINENADEDRIGAKWGLFRGLETAPLSQTIIDFLYGKNDVTEEMLEFVSEQNSGDFSYDQIDFSNVQEIACDYIYSLECQILSERLSERAGKELALFIENFRTEVITPDIEISDDDVCDKAYQLTVMNEILIYLRDAKALEKYELEVLLTVKTPLDYLYDSWIDSDLNIKDGIIDVVSDKIKDLSERLGDDWHILEAEENMEL